MITNWLRPCLSNSMTSRSHTCQNTPRPDVLAGDSFQGVHHICWFAETVEEWFKTTGVMCTEAQRFLWLYCNSLMLVAQNVTSGSVVPKCGLTACNITVKACRRNRFLSVNCGLGIYQEFLHGRAFINLKGKFSTFITWMSGQCWL